MLYYIEYGCSICKEQLIVKANSAEDAENYARVEAEDVYYSYSSNCFDRYEYEDLTDDEFEDMDFEVMCNDIIYKVEKFDKNNFVHTETLAEQNDEPFPL